MQKIFQLECRHGISSKLARCGTCLTHKRRPYPELRREHHQHQTLALKLAFILFTDEISTLSKVKIPVFHPYNFLYLLFRLFVNGQKLDQTGRAHRKTCRPFKKSATARTSGESVVMQLDEKPLDAQ